MIGIVVPNHKERKADMQGRLPKWAPVQDILNAAEVASPKASPWNYELIKALLGEHQERGSRLSVTTLTGGCMRGNIVERKEDYIGTLDGAYPALRGTMIHRTLEASSRAGSLAEWRFYAEVDGQEISGSPDLITYDTIWDWKCLAPEARVLKADLSWERADRLQKDDELIAFDAEGPDRRYRKARVLAAPAIFRERYRVSTSRGDTVVSADHPFLVKLGSRVPEWRRVEDLRPGNRILYAATPWSTSETFDGGYIAGQLDGEGSLGVTKHKEANSTRGRVTWSQVIGPTLDRMETLLAAHGFDVSRHERELGNGYQRQGTLSPRGGMWEQLRLLGTFRPERLLSNPKLESMWEGGRLQWSKYAEVLSVTPLDEGPVIALGTSTGTFIADGMLQHNTTENPPAYSYMYEGHKLQLNYNRFIFNNALKWDAPPGQDPLQPALDPHHTRIQHLAVVYLGPKGPKVLETEKKGPGRFNIPDVWDDQEVLDSLQPRMRAWQMAWNSYPVWPQGLEDFPGWAGPPTWSCLGPPFCYLPGCMAKRYPHGLTWPSP